MTITSTLIDELRQSLDVVLEQRFDRVTYHNGDDVPNTFDLQPGARSVSVDIVRSFGEAQLASPGTLNAPLVQVDFTRDEYPVVMAYAAYSVEFQEKRAQDFTGKTQLIRDKKTEGVYRAIAERLNRFSAIGDTAIGCRGFLNSNLVTPVNSSFNGNTGTFNDYVTFFMDTVISPIINSNRTASFNKVRLPQNLLKKALSLVHPNDAKTTVLEAVNARLMALKIEIDMQERQECNSAWLFANGVIGADNTDRVIVYKYGENSVSRQLEQDLADVFPEEYVQVEGTTQFFPLYQCCSATQINYLEDIQYINIPKIT